MKAAQEGGFEACLEYVQARLVCEANSPEQRLAEEEANSQYRPLAR